MSGIRTHALALGISALLAACGGGSSQDDVAGLTTLPTYAASASPAASAATLTPTEREQVGAITRRWAVDVLASDAADVGHNAVAVPSTHFSRLQAIAAAAAGVTLAEVQGVLSTPPDSALAAALMRDVTRVVWASSDAAVMQDFLDTLTAREHSGTWAGLHLRGMMPASPMPGGDALRLSVWDEFSQRIDWPSASIFDGVFEHDNGSRVWSRLVRVRGPVRTLEIGAMRVDALGLAGGRWLLRIAPASTLASIDAAALDEAIARATAAVRDADSVAAVSGELVLPLEFDFDARGAEDLRGLQSATDPRRADLPRVHRRGGTYAVAPPGGAGLTLDETGLFVRGRSSVAFYASHDGASSFVMNTNATAPWPVSCPATTDLRPAYLALIDDLARTIFLARVSSVDGTPCAS